MGADPFAGLGFVADKPLGAVDFSTLGFQPDAPAAEPARAASQADVRAAEPAPMMPMDTFNANAQAFENAMQRFLKETGGVLKPGQNVRQATAEWAGMEDPEPGRAMAELEHLAQGGDIQYGASVPYNMAKVVGNTAGFLAGGPLGATGSDLVVRGVALTHNLVKAVNAGAIDWDRAAEIAFKEMTHGGSEDLAWNIAAPVLGQILASVPGARPLLAKLAAKFKPGAAPSADMTEQAAAKVKSRVDLAQTPEAKQAVGELSQRIEPQVITPGQVTGKASTAEQTARISGEGKFDVQHEAVKGAAEDMRQAVVAPAGQPSRQALGESIQTLAEESQKAMKARLRPTFQAADASGVKVDFSDVLNRAKAALEADAAVPQGRLAEPERAALKALVADLEGLATPAKAAGEVPSGLLGATGAPIMKPTAPVAATPPLVDAEPALDFISRQKEKLRATTADWKPSKFYETIVGGLTKSADESFARAAEQSGKPEVATALKSAQAQYRDMMTTVYDDAVKQALKKNPEDVGRLFWQKGNVSEPQQLQRLLALAQREGTATAGGAAALNKAMVRGFLQEAVPNIEAASKWSTTLREKPGLRDTWNALTMTPGGSELRSAMSVLEEAAKIAQRGDKELVGQLGLMAIPFRRAAGLGLGVSYITGAIHLPMLALGLSVDATTRLMATAYTQGNKGVLNAAMRALRANSAGTAAGAQVLRETLPVLKDFADANGITDLFVGQPSEGQPSEPEPTGK